MKKIRVETNIHQNIERVFERIKDMESFPRFMRDVKSIKILDEKNNERITKWNIDIDGTPIEWIEEDIFDEQKKVCKFRTLKGDFHYEGKWKIEEIDRNRTHVFIETKVNWEISNLKKYIGNILDKKAIKSFRGMLNAIKKKEEKGRYFKGRIKTNEVPKFAFIAHPYDLDVFADSVVSSPSLMEKNKRTVERAFRWMPPFKRETVEIKSVRGNRVYGDIILVPLICEQILYMDSKFVLEKTIKAGEIGQDMGAKIIGLGAYLSGVGRKGILVDKALDVPVTTGINYTIAVSIDATLKAAELVGIDMDESNVTVVGATGSIGNICSKILSRHVKSINLVARNQERLESLYNEIRNEYSHLQVQYTRNAKQAVKNSDIVLIATNTPKAILSTKDLPQGCIVCDISVPHNIVQEDAEEKGILVIDGGLVQCPSEVNFDYLSLAPGLAYACLSEVIILALEGIYESYSLGGNISFEKVNRIKQLGEKHGFSVSRFRSFGEPIDEQTIDLTRKKVAEKTV